MSELPDTLAENGARAAESFEHLTDRQRPVAARVFALSDFALSAARRQPEWFGAALKGHGFQHTFDRTDVLTEVTAALGEVTEMTMLQRALRQVRQRFQLWLVWRHCAGSASLEETTAGASALADVPEVEVRVREWYPGSD